MMESTLGADTFRDGIRRYMAKYKYHNTETEQLWAELSAAAGKPGKGKKIALIVGIVVLVAGLVFAGITYGPGLYKKIFGGGKIKTEEELGKRAVEAFSKKDYDAFEKMTSISWSKEDWEKAFDEMFAEFTEEDWKKFAGNNGKSVSEMKEEMKENLGVE